MQTATTLRHQGGRLAMTDGPFAETKEQLGGFYLIEARDLNQAPADRREDSAGRLGCVEVRPVKEWGVRAPGVGGEACAPLHRNPVLLCAGGASLAGFALATGRRRRWRNDPGQAGKPRISVENRQ